MMTSMNFHRNLFLSQCRLIKKLKIVIGCKAEAKTTYKADEQSAMHQFIENSYINLSRN